MIDLDSVYNESKEDLQSMNDWCEKLYSDYFGNYFCDLDAMRERFASNADPITDHELEWILITLPLDLMDASEKLSKFKSELEVLKLRYKQQEFEKIEQSQQTTQTRKKEEAELSMIDNKLLNVCYSTVITRVENQISLSKELIMGAKKIFDSRRATENTYPVSESSVMYTQEDYERRKQ